LSTLRLVSSLAPFFKRPYLSLPHAHSRCAAQPVVFMTGQLTWTVRYVRPHAASFRCLCGVEHSKSLPRCSCRVFFGRDADLDALASALAPPTARLIVLSGTPGCGKSALAAEAGRRLWVAGKVCSQSGFEG
jgi:hypothetical protein